MDNETSSGSFSTGFPEVSQAQKVDLLIGWLAKIQAEIDSLQLSRDKAYGVYKAQKTMYDEWLAKRYRKVTKVDKKIRSRKDVFDEVAGEVGRIQGIPYVPTPPTGSES